MPFQLSFHRQRRVLLSLGALAAGPFLPGLSLAANSALPPDDAAPGVMLGKPWQASLNPADYLVSEKLDGVRALWNGRTLRFRSGRPIAAPPWLLAGLPATALDGELWMGRHRFELLSGVVRKEQPVDAEWRAVRYMVFDLPGDPAPFVQRAARIRELLDSASQPWLIAVAQALIADAAGLRARLNEVVAGGGEGLVLHRADALWKEGRSDALRKLKPVPDEEGTVLAQIPGRGKYQGQMGALLLQTPEGQRFALGTGFSDAVRANPPALGSVVSYRYRDRTATGLPKFASFLRVREAE